MGKKRTPREFKVERFVRRASNPDVWVNVNDLTQRERERLAAQICVALVNSFEGREVYKVRPLEEADELIRRRKEREAAEGSK